jgi:flagellar protein FliO/FliZ
MNLFLLLLQEAPPDEINFGALIFRMVLFTGIIVVLIYVVLKKFLPMLARTTGLRERSVKILERLPLDQKRSLLVIEVQEKCYLLGVGEGQINVLMELDRDKLQSKAPSESAPTSFELTLKRMFQKQRPSETPRD